MEAAGGSETSVYIYQMYVTLQETATFGGWGEFW